MTSTIVGECSSRFCDEEIDIANPEVIEVTDPWDRRTGWYFCNQDHLDSESEARQEDAFTRYWEG